MKEPDRQEGGTGPAYRVVAVIEVGTTSIRMVVAQVRPDGTCEPLEQLQQAVSLGRDAFTQGVIGPETTEECVGVLRRFRQVLEPYRLRAPEDVVAVATSAVREAVNRDTFLDRLYIATGIRVEAIDEAEVSRYTYLAIRPLLAGSRVLSRGNTVAVEVGGGSTEVLVLRGGEVESSQTHRLGSLRVRRLLDAERVPTSRLLRVMDSEIRRAVNRIRGQAGADGLFHMLVLGGEARFLAARTAEARGSRRGVRRVALAELEALCDEVLALDVDRVVRQYRLSYPDAETLGPALLILLHLARAFGVRSLHVGFPTLRDGVVAELAAPGPWSDDFRQQILHSARELARRYRVDLGHGERTAALAQQLFGALRAEHKLEARYELLLAVAALLHDVGLFISNRSHHKHSMYLIENSDLFGLGARDIALVAQVARYHRRALPKPTHAAFMALGREQRVAVKKLAALLRVADALDRGRLRAGAGLQVTVERGAVTLTADAPGDLAVEQYALRQKGPLFEQVYGMPVVLRTRRGGRRDESWNPEVF